MIGVTFELLEQFVLELLKLRMLEVQLKMFVDVSLCGSNGIKFTLTFCELIRVFTPAQTISI